jgi:hypothetical protein
MSPARSLIRAYTMDQPEVHEAIAGHAPRRDEYSGPRDDR